MLYEPDPLALAVTLEPEIVLRSERHYVEIELAGKLTRGQTVVDWYHLTGQEPNVNIVLEINPVRFLELLKRAIA